jgi:hypothetical protein
VKQKKGRKIDKDDEVDSAARRGGRTKKGEREKVEKRKGKKEIFHITHSPTQRRTHSRKSY